jgi:hypothetical protein
MRENFGLQIQILSAVGLQIRLSGKNEKMKNGAGCNEHLAPILH